MIWLNDELVDENSIDYRDRGFTLGDGIFETILILKGKACFLEEHLCRLRQSALWIGIKMHPFLDEGIAALLAREKIETGVLRITLTRGITSRGLWPQEDNNTLLIALQPYRMEEGPVSVKIAQECRFSKSILSRIKSMNYLPQIMAQREAVLAGADEALMRNEEGNIASGARANFFASIRGTLITPPLADGALAGVTRQKIMELAEEAGMEVKERSIREWDLEEASEAFLTNSLFLVRPISNIGSGTPEISLNLKKALFDQLG